MKRTVNGVVVDGSPADDIRFDPRYDQIELMWHAGCIDRMSYYFERIKLDLIRKAEAHEARLVRARNMIAEAEAIVMEWSLKA